MKIITTKIVILGDCFVGKSSILDRYINCKFLNNYRATLGLNFLTHDIITSNTHYIIHLWDTAGSERFRSINTLFYRNAEACILVFDLTNYQSFSNISYWYDEFLINRTPNKPSEFPFVLIGNKSDLINDNELINKENEMRENINSNYDELLSYNPMFYKGIVNERMIENFCKEKKIKYFSVSAKNNENIKDAIDYIINSAIKRVNGNNNDDYEFNEISISDVNKGIISKIYSDNNNKCYCF